MGQRRTSREVLLQLLFQAEVNVGKNREILLKDFLENFQMAPEVSDRVRDLFIKITDKQDELDCALESVSENWKVSRMSYVDRNILRLASYELFYCEDVPAEVALDEAVEIAKRFGSEDSGAFVNGILDQVWKQRKDQH